MIRLLQLDLADIEAARDDPTKVGGIPVVDGGLPPSLILDGAAECIRAGRAALWYGPFVFVDSERDRIVGSGIFKGEPDQGRVEIGYGVAASCQGHGYATNAVLALVHFAFAQPGVDAVYAETAVANIASRRVVRKAGFTWAAQLLSEGDGMVDCWFIEAPQAR